MIIALFALAFAMIVGGLLATFFGWDIVLVERGWTMVISGSISAASGALLLGITAAVSRLKRIEAHLSRLQRDFQDVSFEAPRDSKGLSLATASGGVLAGNAAADAGNDLQGKEEEQASLPLFVEENRHEREEEGAVEPAVYPDARQHDAPVLPFPPRRSSEVAARDDDASDMKVPDFLLAERLRDTYTETRISDVDASLYASEPTRDEPARNEPARDESEERDERPMPVIEPTVEHRDEPEPAPEPVEKNETSADAPPEEPRPATIIGTYNSGDNQYVMFSDGSIEAQTPGGVFRFRSLDELKEFIAAGGETNAASST